MARQELIKRRRVRAGSAKPRRAQIEDVILIWRRMRRRIVGPHDHDTTPAPLPGTSGFGTTTGFLAVPKLVEGLGPVVIAGQYSAVDSSITTLKGRAMSIRSLCFAMFAILGAAATASAEAPSKDAAPWNEFHFSERGFVASFPGITEKPKAESSPVSGQNPLLQHNYQVLSGKHTVYSVVVFEFPEGRAPNPPKPDYYQKVVEAYAKGSNAKVSSKKSQTIDRRPGYQAIAEDSRGKRNHLIDLVANGDRIYMLVSAGPKGHANSENAERFRDGFRLLGGPPPPTTGSGSTQ